MTLKRREILRSGLALAGAAAFAPAVPAWAFANEDVRRVSFLNVHTGEASPQIAYWENGAYVPDALAAVNHSLRDWRNNQVHVIEPGLLDLLTAVQAMLGTDERIQVISGYRSPETNAMLHARSEQVSATSLHMQGQAIDIRLPGVELTRLRDAAESLALGGVGYYPVSNFVHVDIGPVQTWSGT
jgi:uncharacterized protein YcbK (DUF882 family)